MSFNHLTPFPFYTYMPFGTPATGSITFKAKPDPTLGTDTITINSVVLTYGTDFAQATTHAPTYRPSEAATQFAECVNACVDRQQWHDATNPLALGVWAVAYGSVVTLFALVPGNDGNSITLATSNSTAFVLSGATLSGGVANSSTNGPLQTVQGAYPVGSGTSGNPFVIAGFDGDSGGTNLIGINGNGTPLSVMVQAPVYTRMLVPAPLWFGGLPPGNTFFRKTITSPGTGNPGANSLVVATAAVLNAINVINPNATAIYLKFWDQNALASVTVQTTLPDHGPFLIPGSGSFFWRDGALPIAFDNGIVAITTSVLADATTQTAPVSVPVVELELQ